MDGETIELDFGWRATLDQQERWLCVQLHPESNNLSPGHGLIERLWKAIQNRGALSVVLEMDDVTFLPSSLMGELVRLHKRLATHNGRLRLSGLRHEWAEALHTCRLDRVLPTFDNRAEALSH
jgi:anti-anti-sigma factor